MSVKKGDKIKVEYTGTLDNGTVFDSSEGKELISKYKIEKVSAIVVTGEIDKVSLEGLAKKENALLLAQVPPPYTDVATGKIEGRVALYTLKDAICEKCNNLTSFISQIKGSGIKVSDEKNIDSNSDEGKELIKKYGIDFVPTVVLSKDAEVYSLIKQAWPRIGTKENDGSYVLRMANPPFINLTTGKLRGIVSIIYLTDKNCTECYDVNIHKEILASPRSFDINLDKEETYDITDAKGKELIDNYNITKVPTVILSNEISAYSSSQALNRFFSVEKDGSYIFRSLSSLGTHKDLTTNQIVVVNPSQEE